VTVPAVGIEAGDVVDGLKREELTGSTATGFFASNSFIKLLLRTK